MEEINKIELVNAFFAFLLKFLCYLDIFLFCFANKIMKIITLLTIYLIRYTILLDVKEKT